MSLSDHFNLTLLDNKEGADALNSRFYGRYNYPWPPGAIQAFPHDYGLLFLNQDMGYYQHDLIPAKPKIWVAGCGTNQALLTALRFPASEVVGTDISAASLEVCRRNAEQLGVQNLRLEEKSLNNPGYDSEFDYIICTGVIHHNADPLFTLKQLRKALSKNGIMELMVYNYYHRLFTTSCQKAIRSFYDASVPDIEKELALAGYLIDGYPYKMNPLMGDFLNAHAKIHEAELADSLIQPVEYSYTVESLNRLAEDAGLELLVHCLNQFDLKNHAYTWNMRFENAFLRDLYNQLPDLSRWQITNLLLANKSPMLWFYLKRNDAGWSRKNEQSITEDFLDTRFRKYSFEVTNYLLDGNGQYQKQAQPLKRPLLNLLEDTQSRVVYQLVDPALSVRDILHKLNIRPDFQELCRLRAALSASLSPYILAVK